MKQIPHFPDYYATKDGQIWSAKSNRFLSLKSKSKGYTKCNLYGEDGKVKNVRVHRVIWQAFNGDIPDNYEVNHKNEIRDDNRLENLELLTHRENLMYGTGQEKRRLKSIELVKRGGDCNFAKSITLIDIKTNEYITFKAKVDAAKYLGVKPSHLTYKLISMRKKNAKNIKIKDNIFEVKE